MLVSIIVCTRNNAESLRQTLASIASCEVPDSMKVELIVVDNGSTDGTTHVVESFRPVNMDVIGVSERKAGLSHARNRALVEAKGEVLLWTDDDIRVPHDWIQRMTDPITLGQVDMIGGGIRLAPHLKRRWMKCIHHAMLASNEMVDPVKFNDVFGANMAFARRILAEVPCFDPALGPGGLGQCDDSLFFRQVCAAGFRTTVLLDAMVEHYCNVSRVCRNGFLAAAERQGKSLAYIEYHWDHLDEPDINAKIKQTLRDLCWIRWCNWKVWLIGAVITRREIRVVQRMAYLQQLAKEQGRPRAYSWHGGKKRL